MRIAIDCRMIAHSGIGTFTRGILENLPDGPEYLLFGDPGRLEAYAGPGRSIEACGTPPLSLKELGASGGFMRADALFCPNYTLLGWRHPRRYVTVHDVLFLDRPEFCINGLDRALKKAYLKFSCARSKGIFTVSRFSADRLKAATGTGRPVTVVPNGLLDAGRARSQAAAGKDPSLLVFVGNLKRHKNLSTLLEAMRILGDRGLPYQLVVIGAGDGLRTKDEALAEAVGRGMSGGRVRFAGWLGRDEMLALLATARYLIQPSLYEGFSIPPLEALACGTQPLISDIPVHREIYGGAPVRFFDPASSEALARAIVEEPDAIGPEAYATLASEKGYDYAIAARNVMEKIMEDA